MKTPNRMREFTFLQASLMYRFLFDRVLSFLPGPGTSAFARLCRTLPPHGFKASGVVIESPSTRLSDVNVGISLLGDRATLKLLYGGLDFAVSELIEEDLDQASEILRIVFEALAEQDVDAKRGRLRLDCLAHLQLEAGEAEDYLRERLPSNDSRVAPDAFAYRVAIKDIEDLRVVVARSVRHREALFVDYAAAYSPIQTPYTDLRRLRQHYEAALATLGLETAQPKAGGNNERTC